MDSPAKNYVGKLNEYAQKNGCKPQYEDLGHDGPDHNRTWVESVLHVDYTDILNRL